MSKKPRNLGDELRGATRLAIEATRGVTDLVEAVHRTIAGGPDVLGRPLEGPVRVLTAPVYGSIRGITRLVGVGLDRALAQLAPLLGDDGPGAEREAVIGALNGVLGDYLEEHHNPLAIEMQLRRQGTPIVLEREALRTTFAAPTGKLLVMLHGSCMNDRQWSWHGHDHGAELARDLGYSPLYLHYNSGRHISTNGRAFAAMLDDLRSAWPVPVSELVLLTHSMGGLVARSACHFAEAERRPWREKLRAMIFLGTPHHGAPLERGGNWIDVLLGVSRYSAPFARLGRIRSAGVTDLRFGCVLDEHWEGRDRFAGEADPRVVLTLPEGVDCYTVAATTAATPSDTLPGDGLVPVDSALGRHAKRGLSLAFADTHRFIAYGTGHLELLGSRAVYEQLRAWLG